MFYYSSAEHFVSEFLTQINVMPTKCCNHCSNPVFLDRECITRPASPTSSHLYITAIAFNHKFLTLQCHIAGWHLTIIYYSILKYLPHIYDRYKLHAIMQYPGAVILILHFKWWATKLSYIVVGYRYATFHADLYCQLMFEQFIFTAVNVNLILLKT